MACLWEEISSQFFKKGTSNQSSLVTSDFPSYGTQRKLIFCWYFFFFSSGRKWFTVFQKIMLVYYARHTVNKLDCMCMNVCTFGCASSIAILFLITRGYDSPMLWYSIHCTVEKLPFVSTTYCTVSFFSCMDSWISVYICYIGQADFSDWAKTWT